MHRLDGEDTLASSHVTRAARTMTRRRLSLCSVATLAALGYLAHAQSASADVMEPSLRTPTVGSFAGGAGSAGVGPQSFMPLEFAAGLFISISLIALVRMGRRGKLEKDAASWARQTEQAVPTRLAPQRPRLQRSSRARKPSGSARRCGAVPMPDALESHARNEPGGHTSQHIEIPTG
jgi:hypothetical protein